MAKIGIISDTHGYLDPLVLEYFAACDEIWHAGDFGSVEVADGLAACKPLRGVYGNIDDEGIRSRFGLDERFECEGVRVWMTHIGGRPGRYDRRVAPLLKRSEPSLFICGHSHIIQVQRDQKHGGMIFLNPGAAGHHGFHLERTAILLEIANGSIGKVQAIELGARGRSRS